MSALVPGKASANYSGCERRSDETHSRASSQEMNAHFGDTRDHRVETKRVPNIALFMWKLGM